MSNQSLTELKRTPKYCTSPFSEHGASKSSDLRWVTEDQANKYPSKVSLGQKICSKCRKKLTKLPCESRSLELTLPKGSSCKEMVHDQPIEEHYKEFIDPDTEMDVLNKSIEIIGESPVKKQRIKSSAYISSKMSKIQQTVSLTLSRRQTGFAVCASSALRSRSRKTGSRPFLADSFAKRGCI